MSTPVEPTPGTITAIRPLPADPNQRCIIVDDREAARLTAADVERLELAVGDPWTAEREETVRVALATNVARRDAMAALGRRALSRHELHERLARKHEPDLCGVVVEECVEHGWIDDGAYARDFAEEILRRGAVGAPVIVQRLARRGIDRDLAEQVAREVLAGRDEVEAATALARSRLGEAPDEGDLRRVAAMLARRGFDEDTTRLALDRLGGPLPDAYD